jgi:beta-galactosidase
MTRFVLIALGCMSSPVAWGNPNHVTVKQDEAGYLLLMDGSPYFVRGMNWDYLPIGENYRYSLWNQPDEVIETALRRELGLLREAGVNSIRQYPDIPPRWVEWIWVNYGISTMINPLVGRYGTEIDGRFVPVTDYSDPTTRAVLRAQTLEAVEKFKDTPGVLMWLLGNENNYGLTWSGFEIQNLPEGERDAARARYLYSLMGELVDAIHAADPNHPVALANGDLQYIDLIKEECPNLDIMGSNVYRGMTARDLYQVVEEKLGVPFVYSEFGADAYDAKAGREDHLTQAVYLRSQWLDIYNNAYGQGAGNAIGGYVFQWSDGWWKYKQEENLDIHDSNASWSTGAYAEDFVEGQFNMNEEWFGITAKGPPDAQGQYELFPRAGFYVLRDAWRLDPYAPDTTAETIQTHFAAIDPQVYDRSYKSALAIGQLDTLSKAYVSNVRLELSTFGTTDSTATGQGKERFTVDHLESFYLETKAKPTDDFRAALSLNVLGNVPVNRIDPIFYETRGRQPADLDDSESPVNLASLERVRVYQASFTWEHDLFTMDGFFRKPHFHWGYEGDFFGLYREANYGPNIDIYNGDAPLGVEFTGKGALEGLRLAFGPELFWGANPSVVGLYERRVGNFDVSVAHQEDLAAQGSVQSTFAVPDQLTRRSTLAVARSVGPFKVDVGGIMAGTERLGVPFTRVVEASGDESYLDSGYDVIYDEIVLADTLGARARVVGQMGRFHVLGDASYKGLVANGGVDTTQVFTGWTLRQSGRGNQVGGNFGFAAQLGAFQIAPNVLLQRPLVGPNPVIGDQWGASTGWYSAGVKPRNVLDDPFAVLENRETKGFELLLAYDPTPGTWMWAWDNDDREDARLAGSLDVTYRIMPTSRDSNFGFLDDGTLFSFDDAPPAANLWDARLNTILNTNAGVRFLVGAYAGTGQARGSDPRLITRYGGDLGLRWRALAWDTTVKIDDWGPYDFHQDYNLTFPLQINTDLSGGLTARRIGQRSTRLGITGKFRTLDQYSVDWVAVPGYPDALGYQLEIGTYFHVSL